MSLRAAALVLRRRSNLTIIEGIASGKEHTCPGGQCQGVSGTVVAGGARESALAKTAFRCE